MNVIEHIYFIVQNYNKIYYNFRNYLCNHNNLLLTFYPPLNIVINNITSLFIILYDFKVF